MWRVVHQSGVGGKRVVVRRTRCDLVRIGRREAIRRQARTGRGLTRVRIERRNGEGLRERLHFRLAEADVLKAADRNQLHAVAGRADFLVDLEAALRSEEHTSELQSLMRISYAVFCLEKTTTPKLIET